MQIDRPITISIIFLLTLLFTFFLIVPKYNDFRNFQVQLSITEAEYNAKYAYFAEVTRAYDQILKNEDVLKKIDSALPQKTSFGELVYFFQGKAAENGLVVKGLFLNKAAPINQESNVKEINFFLTIIGTYSALKNFLASLEKSSRLFEVSDISFSLSNLPSGYVSDEFLQTYTFRLEIRTYSY